MWNPSNRIRTIATKILLSIFTLTSIFHILALLQIVPYKYLWGGRLQSLEEMYVMETISLLANIFFVYCSYLYLQYLNDSLVPLWIRMVFGFISAIFFLNTIGNLIAVTDLETLLATPVTAFLSVVSFTLVPKYEYQTSEL
ncbi:hypothetical protein LEP1GSC202_1492 [Leptospira yanagawae serovar Saopaulo str. Sao Paulo = ATCC 700523]|uniref:Uncharacterized protein n=1 Tax=Leptospira yanagawae serovar Saopaulo str. Sao Paulo = ATCC 700523 TaxID=1249483 RepID=A0A5E8HEX8_9LEPT|nr:hypothetical protein [Leptospira yanagawae]EOQ90031.1 hypothetical protein LEP1GSC202_1492 [Leptospira yanagawae serovar Saopaulo str. Sao Paulo = ATCC 700523]